MSFPLWFLDFTNLSDVLDWRLGLIVLLFKLIGVSYMLMISSLVLPTLWLLFPTPVNNDRQQFKSIVNCRQLSTLPIFFLSPE